ncbi:DNA polymerase [Sporosarcina sp. SAFN-015]|uniref:DNA polymerase n=1 Tax=Sporosarcina sp. SAFN-015 TaxID=3387274 RepID=UPI003F7FC495
MKDVKLTLNLRSPTAEASASVAKAAATKRANTETLDEAWARILATKLSDLDRARLASVRAAMDAGKLGRDPADLTTKTGRPKRFSKAEALRLYAVLEEQTRVERLAEMVENKPDNYVLITDKTALQDAIDVMSRETLVVFDVETTGVDVYRDKIVGHVLSATSADVHYYIPTDHQDASKPQLDRDYVASALKPLYENADIGFIAHNAKFDLQMLRNNFGIDVKNLAWDSQEAMILLNENEPSKALKVLATKYLRDESYTYGQLFGDRGFDEVDLTTALAYAAKDGDITYRLYEFQREHLAQHGNMLRYFETVEMPLLKIVSDMELRGYDIDTDYASIIAEDLRKQAEAAHKRVVAALGDDVNLNSPAQLKTAIETHVGKTIADTDAKKTLKPLAKDWPIIADLLEYREVTKLLSTYYDALPSLINERTGRIHTRLHQNGAKTGRFSSGGSGSFNIQNQSGEARKMFVAPPGKFIVNADFSAQEVRIIASVSQEEVLLDAFARGVDAYATLASEFFGKPYEECYKMPDGSDTPERKMMKVVLLSSMYGASKYGLSESLGISVEKAEQFRLDFFAKYRKIAQFIEDTQAFAKREGFVWIGDEDRKRRLPEARQKEKRIPYGKWNDPKYKKAREVNSEIRRAMRQGPNARIQGLAAIQTKVTMVALDALLKRKGWEWFAPIHDELAFITDDALTAEDIAEIDRVMTHSYLLPGVENGTDIEIQRRWSDSITARDYLAGKAVPAL